MATVEKKTTVANKEEMVTIKLPREKDKSPVEFVSVNERTWLIKRGVEVEVPACVAALIKNQERMEEEAENFKEATEK